MVSAIVLLLGVELSACLPLTVHHILSVCLTIFTIAVCLPLAVGSSRPLTTCVSTTCHLCVYYYSPSLVTHSLLAGLHELRRLLDREMNSLGLSRASADVEFVQEKDAEQRLKDAIATGNVTDLDNADHSAADNHKPVSQHILLSTTFTPSLLLGICVCYL